MFTEITLRLSPEHQEIIDGCVAAWNAAASTATRSGQIAWNRADAARFLIANGITNSSQADKLTDG